MGAVALRSGVREPVREEEEEGFEIDALARRFVSGDHAQNRRSVKQIGTVHKTAEQTVRPVVEFQIKIKLGSADLKVKLVQVPSRLERCRRRARKVLPRIRRRAARRISPGCVPTSPESR